MKQGLSKVDILRMKFKLMKDLLELTNKQTNLIKNNDLDTLEVLIKNKQLIIDEIDRIDSLYDLEHDDNDDTIQLKKEIHNIVVEILERDNKNKEFMEEYSGKVKAKLCSLKQGKKVASGYYSKPLQTYGYFIDKKK